jgi:peptide/nickel transport system permease protein
MVAEALTLARPTTKRERRVARSWWLESAARFRRQRVAALAGGALVLLVLLALLAPLIAPHDPAEQFRRDGLTAAGLPLGPTAKFWFGTDGLGRDMFSRLLFGARISLAIGFVASSLAVLTGVLVGGVAGMAGGWTDTLLMRFVDLVMSLPTLFVILLFVILVGPSLSVTIAVIALLGWTYPSRVFRSEILALREREYVVAARMVGALPSRVFLRHVLPQILPLIVIYIGLGIPGAIFAEAALGFLGLGVPPPAPSWGGMINTGINYFRASPAQVLLPGAAIVATVICSNLVGNGLRDALDPTVGEG